MAILAQPNGAMKAANAVVKIVKPPTSTAPVSAVAAGGSVRAALPNAAQVARTPNAAAMTNQQRLASDPSYKQSETQRALNVIAQRQAQGQDISMQQKYLQKNLGYTGIIPASAQAPTNQLQNYVPITSQQQQNANQSQALFGNALQTLNAQNPQQQQLQDLMQQYATKQFDPFAYNRETDPNYAAGLAATKQNISSGTNQVMAELNRRGILNSTITGDRSSQIAADAVSNLETQLVPQYYNQAFQMWQAQQNAENQQFTNQYNLAQMYDTQRQNEFSNQRTLGVDYNTLAQQDFQNRLATADRTGNLQTAELETAIQNVQALKQLASAKGITKEQRDAYSKQADVYRAQIDAMGGDSKLFGSNVTAKQASQRAQAGVRTVQGQQLDLQNKQTNIDTALRYGEQAGRLLTPQSDPSGYLRQVQKGAPLNLAGNNQQFNQAMDTRKQNFGEGLETRKQNFTESSFDRTQTFNEQSWATEFEQRVTEFGAQNALSWAAQYLNEAQLQEVIRSNQAGESIDAAKLAEMVRSNMVGEDQGWVGLDLDGQRIAAGGEGGASYDGLTQSQIIDSIKEQFARDVPVYDEDGDQTGTKSQYPKNKDAATKAAIYESVIAYGLPAGQEDQTLLALGLTQKDIAELDKQYADAAATIPSGGGGGGGGPKPNTAQQASFKPGSNGLTFNNGTSGYNNYYKAQKFVGTENFNKNGAVAAQAIKDGGYPAEWLPPLLELIARESGFNSNAANPKSSARGLMQFLNGTRADHGGNAVDWSDPYQQVKAGLKYIKGRYGTPTKALQFWDKNNYY